MQILDTKEFLTFSIKVTEPIQSKNLFTFFRTSLLQSDLTFNTESYFYYSYHETTSTYELIIFPKNTNNIFLEPFLFLENSFEGIEENDNVVYVTFTYFVFFENKKLILLKKTSNNSLEEIQTYISQLYNIKDIKVKFIESEELNILKNKKLQSSVQTQNYKIYPIYEDKSFRFFRYFLMISFFSFCLMLYFSYDNSSTLITNTNKVTNSQETPYLHNKPLDNILPLFQEMANHHLLTKKLYFKNNTIEMVLFHQSKDELLIFLNNSKYKILMKSLKYDSMKKAFSMDVIVEL